MSKICNDHPNENCSFICTERECKNRRIICSECCLTTHYEHETRSLKLALADIAADLQPNPRVLTLVASIDKVYSQFRSGLQRVKGEEIDLDMELQRFFRDIHTQVETYRQVCIEVLQASNGAQMNRCLKGYRFFARQDVRDSSNFQLFLEDILEFLQWRWQLLEAQLKAKANPTAILKLFIPYGSESSMAYRFSDKNKQASIKLSTDCLTATQDDNYNNNMVLIEPLIEGKRRLRGKCSIRFKIGKVSSWLAVGVAYARQIRNANFELDTGNIGHGAYVISYNGYSFHNDDSALNSYYHPFNYAEGDVLVVTVNASSERVRVTKQNGDSLELPYKRQPGEDLHFCILLRSPGESLSIIN